MAESGGLSQYEGMAVTSISNVAAPHAGQTRPGEDASYRNIQPVGGKPPSALRGRDGGGPFHGRGQGRLNFEAMIKKRKGG